METKPPSLVFHLDATSAVAPYRQLVDQVATAIRAGQLLEGDQLPSVRTVVTQVTINPNTVHRAYREMEHLGLVESRLGLGTFVATKASEARLVADPVVTAVRAERQRGRAADDILSAVHHVLQEEA
jgi:GntR family transcriptional regulator